MRYFNALGRPYDEAAPRFRSVRFAISRYWKVWTRLRWAEPQTEAQAIRAAEEFLSRPIDPAAYRLVASDLLAGTELGDYQTRGDILGCAIDLVDAKAEGEELRLINAGP